MISKVLLVNPRGFCAGVDRAIEIVESCLTVFGKPVYVRHEIVHNQHVVRDLEKKGAIFVEDLEEIPKGNVVVLSAHGVAPSVKREANERELNVIDATCPLVAKVHIEAIKFHNEGYSIVLIGHHGHQEVIGTMGEAPMSLVENVQDVEKLELNSEKIVYLTQTTLSIDDTKDIIEALKKKFPHIDAPKKEDICYATTNRQNAVKELAKKCDIILVVGAYNSSNSLRLVETAKNCAVDSYLVPDITHLKQEWLEGNETVGITSGASAPEILVQELIDYFKGNGAQIQELDVIEEKTIFPIPPSLQNLVKQQKQQI